MNEASPLPRYISVPALVGYSMISAVLLILAFPPTDLGPLAWVALVPLFFALSQTRTVLQGGLCGFVFALVFFGHYVQFLLPYGTFPWAIAALYQAFFGFIFGVAAGPAMRLVRPGWRVLGGATAWTLCAYLRAHAIPIPFTGGDLAFSQFDQIPILQVVSIVGQFGLTFAIACVNAALSQALLGVLPMPLLRADAPLKWWSQASARVAVACYVLLILSYIWGAFTIKVRSPEEGQSLEVTVAEGNCSPRASVTEEDMERSRLTYLRLSQLVPDETDLTVWPEAALPSYIQQWPELDLAARDAARETGGYLLAGALEDIDGVYYNAAILYDPTGQRVDEYYKVDLVAFGEYVPFREHLQFLNRYPIRQRDFTPGHERTLMDVKGVKIAPLICFEAMFPDASREICALGAQAIVFMTGDPWEGQTIEPAQHSHTAPIRAVESRRYVCRAATSGESAIYDPYGEQIASVPVFTEGIATETIYARDAITPYHRMGDLPLVLIWAALYCLAFLRGNRAP
ncbi:MAG: apolipoprotein N-acyltransferase [Armatimonadetes bacterium]|nr:apolipoprotein N-acyltransferase [Armatimonadota bacterium]